MNRWAPVFVLLEVVGCNGKDAHGGELRKRLESLSFDPHDPPNHVVNVSVGLYFDHLFLIDEHKHAVDSDFHTLYTWNDPRNYSMLFADGVLTDVDPQTSEDGEACPATAVSSARFVEFGSLEVGLVYAPDLHVSNLAADGKSKVHTQMFRLFEDGRFEWMQHIFARTVLKGEDYRPFPFDTHHVTIKVESESHSRNRIQLSVNPDLTGLDAADIENWPGWFGDGLWTAEVHDHRPEYTRLEAARCRHERLSEFQFQFAAARVSQTYVHDNVVPVILLVLGSWGAFYLPLGQVMPRIAVGFVSFLTISNWASSSTAILPKVTYTVWLGNFMSINRIMVFLAMIETAFAVYVKEHMSTQTATSLDRFFRLFLPLDYTVIMVVVFASCGAQWGSDLWVVGYVNLGVVIATAVAYVAVMHRKVLERLVRAPLAAHVNGTEFDKHELHALFSALDADGDEALTMEEVVAGLWRRHSGGGDGIPGKAEMLQKLVSRAGPVVNREQFKASHRLILAEMNLTLRAARKLTDAKPGGAVASAPSQETHHDRAKKVGPMSDEP